MRIGKAKVVASRSSLPAKEVHNVLPMAHRHCATLDRCGALQLLPEPKPPPLIVWLLTFSTYIKTSCSKFLYNHNSTRLPDNPPIIENGSVTKTSTTKTPHTELPSLTQCLATASAPTPVRARRVLPPRSGPHRAPLFATRLGAPAMAMPHSP